MRKVLIVSGSIGEGHNQVALALKNYLVKTSPELKIETVDFLNIEKSFVNVLLKRSYFTLIKKLPIGYKLLYNFSEKGKGEGLLKDLLITYYKRAIQSYLAIFEPDFIIFTHPFPCAVFSYLKESNLIPEINSAVIMTDYAVHPVWVYKQIDYYFVGTEEMKKQLIKYGIPESRVFATGIPIREDFYDTYEKEIIFNELGLSSDKPKILVMGGGLGLGAVEEVLKALNYINKDFEVIVVAGKNQLLKERLIRKFSNSNYRLVVLGYYEQISKLMSVADLLISKAGGITLSEAIAKNIPMIIYKPLPGHEEKNAIYAVKENQAVWLKKTKDLETTITKLVQQRESFKGACRINQIRENSAGQKISKVIIKNIS